MSGGPWVYRDSTEREGGRVYPLFTVGFFRPDGEWEPESDHSTRGEAAARVNYLNGHQAQGGEG